MMKCDCLRCGAKDLNITPGGFLPTHNIPNREMKCPYSQLHFIYNRKPVLVGAAHYPIPPVAATSCKQCGHPRNNHSTQGCLYNGKCPYGCTIKYTDRDMFE